MSFNTWYLAVLPVGAFLQTIAWRPWESRRHHTDICMGHTGWWDPDAMPDS